VQGNPKGVILSHAAVNANASTADIVYNVRHLNRGRKSQQTNLPFRLSPFSVFEQCDWTHSACGTSICLTGQGNTLATFACFRFVSERQATCLMRLGPATLIPVFEVGYVWDTADL
jgi:hypothetical protein